MTIRYLPEKLSNEVELSLSPNYSNPEFEAVDFGEAEVEGEEDDEWC